MRALNIVLLNVTIRKGKLPCFMSYGNDIHETDFDNIKNIKITNIYFVYEKVPDTSVFFMIFQWTLKCDQTIQLEET